MEQNLLVVVSVIFALSLVGAFVLFKFLKSAAIIKRPGYQAGGALAGFLLIFGALYVSYSELEANAAERAAAVALWTVAGDVFLEGDDQNSADVEVSDLRPRGMRATGVLRVMRLLTESISATPALISRVSVE